MTLSESCSVILQRTKELSCASEDRDIYLRLSRAAIHYAFTLNEQLVKANEERARLRDECKRYREMLLRDALDRSEDRSIRTV